MNIDTIEYIDSEGPSTYYLTIGRGAPWQNYHMRISLRVFRFVNSVLRRTVPGVSSIQCLKQESHR